MAVIVQLRRGNADVWETNNPTLAVGEMGVEIDTGRFKVGDGTTEWNSLAYSSGEDGSTWYVDQGVPGAELGSDHDLYLNTADGEVYRKADGAWTSLGNLTGPQGEKGDAGATWYSGEGEPGEELGADDDLYLDTLSGDVYIKDGTWSSQVNLTGPQGPTGGIAGGTLTDDIDADGQSISGAVLAGYTETAMAHDDAEGVVTLRMDDGNVHVVTLQDETTLEFALPGALRFQRLAEEDGGHDGILYGVAWSADGTRLATSANDNLIKIWDTSTWECLETLDDHTQNVYSVAWHPDGTRLASASGDMSIRIWDTETWTTAATLTSANDGHNSYVERVTFSSDGSMLASCSEAADVIIWNTTTWERIERIVPSGEYIWDIAFNHDGSLLAAAEDFGHVYVWDTNTWTLAATLEDEESQFRTVAFSPDSTRLIASVGTTLYVWETETWGLTDTLTGHTGNVRSVAFRPDGAFLVSAAQDNTLKLWDTATWDTVRTIEGHTNDVLSVAFAPDGRAIASGSSDRTIGITLNYEPVDHADKAVSLTVVLIPSTHAANFPESVLWRGGEEPALDHETATYILTFLTVDGGVRWFGMEAGEFVAGN